MADEPAAAAAPASAPESAPVVADPPPTPEAAAKPAKAVAAPAGAPADGKFERIAALIRTGLSNTAISRDGAAWQALETRLPEIVAAIIKEA